MVLDVKSQGKEAKNRSVHLHSGDSVEQELSSPIHLQTSSLKFTFEKQNGVKADTS